MGQVYIDVGSFELPRRSLSCNGRHVSGPEIWPQCLAGQCGDSTPKAVVTPSPTPRCSCPRQLKPAVFMEPIVGDGDEPMTLRHPSKLRNRRPFGRRFRLSLRRRRVPGRAEEDPFSSSGCPRETI